MLAQGRSKEKIIFFSQADGKQKLYWQLGKDKGSDGS